MSDSCSLESMRQQKDPHLGEASAGAYFSAALYTFAVFGWELVLVLLVDPLIGRELDEGIAALAHWALTAIGWLVGAIFILRAIRRRGARLGGAFSHPLAGHRFLRVAGFFTTLAIAILIRLVLLHEWKPAAEYGTLRGDYGERAFLAALLLLVYYACEALVIVLVIALGQRAGERLAGRSSLPWGGLVLALTWGAVHILLQGPAAGLYAMVAATLYGIAYALGSRRLLPSWLGIGLAFIL